MEFKTFYWMGRADCMCWNHWVKKDTYFLVRTFTFSITTFDYYFSRRSTKQNEETVLVIDKLLCYVGHWNERTVITLRVKYAYMIYFHFSDWYWSTKLFSAIRKQNIEHFMHLIHFDASVLQKQNHSNFICPEGSKTDSKQMRLGNRWHD